LANSASGVEFADGDKDLQSALTELCQELAYFIVQDAEGGTKVLHLSVQGAKDDQEAEKACRTIAHSPLVKTALFGQDPNWGRIVAALGRSGTEFVPEDVSVQIAGTAVFKNGVPVDIDLDKLLAPHLQRKDIHISLTLGQGQGSYSMLASDLSHDYVQLNSAYRS
jgi:glutamate N-acetyltransferase/amino-acid N-acetyltransferase